MQMDDQSSNGHSRIWLLSKCLLHTVTPVGSTYPQYFASSDCAAQQGVYDFFVLMKCDIRFPQMLVLKPSNAFVLCKILKLIYLNLFTELFDQSG